MLTDPQTLTVGGQAKTLNRIATNGTSSTYRTADEAYEFTISHQRTKANRTRHEVKVTTKAVAANPVTSSNARVDASFYFVIDQPEFGFTDTQLNDLAQAVFGWATASAGAKTLQVLEDQH